MCSISSLLLSSMYLSRFSWTSSTSLGFPSVWSRIESAAETLPALADLIRALAIALASVILTRFDLVPFPFDTWTVVSSMSPALSSWEMYLRIESFVRPGPPGFPCLNGLPSFFLAIKLLMPPFVRV